MTFLALGPIIIIATATIGTDTITATAINIVP
jgi:hypothetical protein